MAVKKMLTHVLTHAQTSAMEAADQREQVAEAALLELSRLTPEDPGRARVREDVINTYAPLARKAALRFQRRGEEVDDLIQVAMIGLIKAVDRFDPERGIHFVHYALPTMTGELKRHFRDKAWSVRVNRGLQELHLRIARAIPDLSQSLQRTPTLADLAEHLEVTEEEIQNGLQCAGAYATRSLNDFVPGSDETPLAELVGEQDRQLEMVPDRMALREIMGRLPEREQQILRLRFMDNLTQADIANLIGVSQMHVSRLLTRAFAQLREMLLEDD
jgi:RNA polymerase sigma-B factor